MTVHLEEQIRDYTAYVVELSTPIGLDALTTETPATAQALPRGRRLQARWGVAVAAATILLVVIGGLALGSRLLSPDEPPVITTPTPSTSVPAPTTSVPAPTTTLVDSGSAPPMNWEQVPPQASLGAGDEANQYLIHSVINGGPGLIAVGEVRPSSDQWWLIAPGDAAVWLSEDGRTWERVPDPDGVFTGGLMIDDIAATSSGYVAIGAAEESGFANAAVWLSADGHSWSRVDSPNFVEANMNAVAVGDPGIVAVGGGFIWFSPDGRTWSQVETPRAAGLLRDVAFADWGFVAVGARSHEYFDIDSGEYLQAVRPHAWISANGLDWERIELHPSTEEWVGASPHSVLVVEDTVIAAGSYARTYNSHFDAVPTFWTTTNGVDWTRTILEDVLVSGMDRPQALIGDIVRTDGGLVAVGEWNHAPKYNGDTSRGRVAAWASSDGGATWIETPPGTTFPITEAWSYMSEAAVFGNELIAVGSHEGRAAVWVGVWTD